MVELNETAKAMFQKYSDEQLLKYILEATAACKRTPAHMIPIFLGAIDYCEKLLEERNAKLKKI
jgi:hypothetical protein